jgi:formamidopyrimidine-DNA glycosylase
MPELPEVEHAARKLDAAARGKAIDDVSVRHPVYERVLHAADARHLIGRTITSVTRRGKYQLVTLDDGSVLTVHFGMTGDWAIASREEPEDRFARFVLELSDGTRAALSDARALGRVRLYPKGAVALPKLGPEPLGADFTAKSLGASLAKRRGPIKQALLDQIVVAGLGNIYVGEALWLARVSPRAAARSLGAARRGRLVTAIRRVLAGAPAARYHRTVVTGKRGTEGAAGSVAERRHEWRVYDREGEECRRCGARIKRITQGGRSTYYCPRCQRT